MKNTWSGAVALAVSCRRIEVRMWHRLARTLAGLIAAVSVGFGMALAAAPDTGARAQLDAFARSVQAASGTFTQQTQSARGGQAQPAHRGEFLFKRPGQFKWVVQEPYDQVVVSDGQQLFQYDPDLAQVSVRPVSDALGNAPAAVLFGQGALDRTFVLQAQPERDGLQWIRATPRSAEAGFAHMDIGLANNLPQRVEILDAFGQRTVVEFTTLVPNPSLPPDAFQFVPPPGVDVVRMR